MSQRARALGLLKSSLDGIGDAWPERCLLAIYLFDFLDRLRLEGFPEDWMDRLERELVMHARLVDHLHVAFERSKNSFDHWEDQKPEAVEARTGRTYFDLWRDFSREEYYMETERLLRERFERNNIVLEPHGRALDDGCGGGRYTLALKSMGFDSVTGVDISPDSVAFAESMNNFPDSVDFMNASVLELPFENATFDFGFSNGVLHHTTSTQTGLNELARVLKPGAPCWLYLYGGKDSFFWDAVDTCRASLRDIPQSYTQTFMATLGYPPGRIFHRVDFWYVPIHRRYFEAEVLEMVAKAGFTNVRRLHRGTGHDWDEFRYEFPDMDPYLYGEGEMRFWMERGS